MAESKGIQSDLIPRIATGFCAGIGRTGSLCGAVSGGVLALNLCHGRTGPTDSPEAIYAKVRRLIEHFEQQFGTSNCPELIGCDLSTEAGQMHFKQDRLIDRCRHFTQAATRIVVELG